MYADDKALAEYQSLMEKERIDRELIQVLIDAGTPPAEAVRFVINPFGATEVRS